MKPQIPVEGRLRHFLGNWHKITTDQWVPSTIKEGYKLEFLENSQFTGIRPTIVPVKEQTHILEEINTLLRKRCYRKSTCAQQGFLQYLLPSSQKEWQNAPCDRAKKHFKMYNLSKVINFVRPKDWAITINLADAYLHISIFPKHRKFLRFCFQGQCYQWKVMCFDPSSAPRTWTKLVSVATAYLRTMNVRLAVYFRRLAKSESNQTSNNLRQETMPVSSSLTRIYDQPRKVKSKSKLN